MFYVIVNSPQICHESCNLWVWIISWIDLMVEFETFKHAYGFRLCCELRQLFCEYSCNHILSKSVTSYPYICFLKIVEWHHQPSRSILPQSLYIILSYMDCFYSNINRQVAKRVFVNKTVVKAITIVLAGYVIVRISLSVRPEMAS